MSIALALAAAGTAAALTPGQHPVPRSWPGRPARVVDGDPVRRSRALAGLAAVGAAGASVLLVGGAVGVLVAAVAGAAVFASLRRWLSRPAPAAPGRDVALALDLAAAALRAGRAPADALLLAAPAARGDAGAALVRVATMVRLGADPTDAWAGADAVGLAELRAVAIRSSTSGIRLAAAFERLAATLRADRQTAAAARAQRAGVQALGPLAACFLPSFVCLGIVPVIVGLATSALPGPR